jgi:hypothetical protein
VLDLLLVKMSSSPPDISIRKKNYHFLCFSTISPPCQ